MKPGVLRDLVDAMDAAERGHALIPCKQEPELWTDDRVTTRGLGAERVIDITVSGCKYCPVMAECLAYLEVSNANPRTQLYGVVAGHVTTEGHTRRIFLNPRRRTA